MSGKLQQLPWCTLFMAVLSWDVSPHTQPGWGLPEHILTPWFSSGGPGRHYQRCEAPPNKGTLVIPSGERTTASSCSRHCVRKDCGLLLICTSINITLSDGWMPELKSTGSRSFQRGKGINNCHWRGFHLLSERRKNKQTNEKPNLNKTAPKFKVKI